MEAGGEPRGRGSFFRVSTCIVLVSLGPGQPGLLSTAVGADSDAGGSLGALGEILSVLVWAGASAVEAAASRGLGVPVLVVRAGSISSCFCIGGSTELPIVPKDPLLCPECISIPALVAASTLVFLKSLFVFLASLASRF